MGFCKQYAMIKWESYDRDFSAAFNELLLTNPANTGECFLTMNSLRQRRRNCLLLCWHSWATTWARSVKQRHSLLAVDKEIRLIIAPQFIIQNCGMHKLFLEANKSNPAVNDTRCFQCVMKRE